MYTFDTSAETRQYELTYLIPVSYTQSERTAIDEQVAQLVKKHGGEVTNTDDWGKRPLAYKIQAAKKQHEEAFYTHRQLSMPADKTQEFEAELKLVPGIIRQLLVVVE